MQMGSALEMNYGRSYMDLSQSSKISIDPLSDVLSVLGVRVARQTRLEASGRWAFAFPAVDRLKFVAVLRGSQWMLLSGCAPQLMNAGDVCLVGRTAYAVASHPAEPPIDGQALYAGCDMPKLGVTIRLGSEGA